MYIYGNTDNISDLNYTIKVKNIKKENVEKVTLQINF